MAKKQKPKTRPQTPDDLTGPNLNADGKAECDRICDEIEQLGRQIQPADRALLTLYARTWCINRECYQHIRQYGPIIKYANGVPGASPQYKTYKETASLMKDLLEQLGCTPKARKFDELPATQEKEDEDKELEF